MRPTFLDLIAAEAGIEIVPCERDERRGRHHGRAATDAAYRQWRRKHVIFMRGESDPYHAVVRETGDLPVRRDAGPP